MNNIFLFANLAILSTTAVSGPLIPHKDFYNCIKLISCKYDFHVNDPVWGRIESSESLPLNFTTHGQGIVLPSRLGLTPQGVDNND